MSLALKDTIHLNTPLGVSEIQLFFGDITRLPPKDKVDIIFVSAFPGDYTPVPGTMIGALERNLGLSVAKLAKDKEADLRKSFNCWISKPLPSHLSYRHLVCFERMNRFEKLSEQISGMFRAMMPVFNNEDTSVITPLLASGNQGHSEVMVLKAIVPAACHWIQAGLPLRCLKIVIYTQNTMSISSSSNNLLDAFASLKAKWEETQNKQVTKIEKTIDVCLSFSAEDEDFVDEICKGLEKVHTGIVIHKEELYYDHDACWQENIFAVMINSHKIIAVLTPNYVNRTECLEQYNIALCCNRLTGAEVLAPFYVQTVNSFPSYMTIIQYTECRVRKTGEKKEEKIFTACCMLVKEIDDNKIALPASDSMEPKGGGSKGDIAVTDSLQHAASTSYDVFISYAHKTPVAAHKLYENLLLVNPDMKVFLDRSELRTGNRWQEALYEAVDKAKVVVAFISDSYMQSVVCHDEYNIALARYMSSDNIYFLPLLTSTDRETLPAMFSEVPVVDMRQIVYEEDHFCLAETVLRWIRMLNIGKPAINIFYQVEPRKTRISYVTVKWRERYFDENFEVEKDSKRLMLRKPDPASLSSTTASTNESITATSSSKPDQTDAPSKVSQSASPTKLDETTSSSKSVVFSFAQECLEHASILAQLVREESKGEVTCEFLSPTAEDGVQAPKLQLLDTADLVVVLVSDDYLESHQHLDQLHIALCRQRMCKDQRVVYLIEAHHTHRRPVYMHLLHYNINMCDELWTHFSRKQSVDVISVSVDTPNQGVVQMYCSLAEYNAMFAAALDINAKLKIGKTEGGSGMPSNIINLLTHKKTDIGPVPLSESLVPFSKVTEIKSSSVGRMDSSSEGAALLRSLSEKLQKRAAHKKMQIKEASKEEEEGTAGNPQCGEVDKQEKATADNQQGGEVDKQEKAKVGKKQDGEIDKQQEKAKVGNQQDGQTDKQKQREAVGKLQDRDIVKQQEKGTVDKQQDGEVGDQQEKGTVGRRDGWAVIRQHAVNHSSRSCQVL